MPQTVTKMHLSESDHGRRIVIASTGGTGQLVHTAVVDGIDDIYLDVFNGHTDVVDVYVYFGGVMAPGDNVAYFSIPPYRSMQGVLPLLRGCLSGGKEVRVLASVESRITIGGDVNRGVNS